MPASRRGAQCSALARPAWRSRICAKETRCEKAWAQRTGPILTDWRSCRRAVLASTDMRVSCQWISSLTASGPVRGHQSHGLGGVRRGAEGMRTHVRDCCGLPCRSGGSGRCGALTSRAAAPPANRRRISSAMSSSPRPKARVRAMASRGRVSPGASASNSPSTRSAQSAAHTATIRRSTSLSACGEPTPQMLPGSPTSARRPATGPRRACKRPTAKVLLGPACTAPPASLDER